MADVSVEIERPERPVTSRAGAPRAYRAMSAKIPAMLTAAGGVFTVLGGLGLWVRATESTAPTEAPQLVEAVMGHAGATGWALAAFGAVAAIGSWTWLTRGLLPKLVPVVASLTIAALAIWRLILLDETVRSMIADARRQAEASREVGSAIYHAGWGWGAWFLLMAAVLLVLGMVAGLLRELDTRKGVAE